MKSEATPRHLLIAGTGRAGTSFLVRYLHAVGLDTHLSRQAQGWSDSANAGLEDFPLSGEINLPYVIKTPWMGEFIDQLLRGNFEIDAVLIPVRDLRDAASSRSILEHCSIYNNAKWMLSMDETWDEWAVTVGGVIYSLDPVDQERLLAVKFARLVHALVRAGVKMIFLDFPRITEDAEYLFGMVHDFLPSSVDLLTAVEAHRKVVDRRSVRVSEERKAARNSGATIQATHQMPGVPPMQLPLLFSNREVARKEVDLIALRREIARSKAELRDADTAVRRLQEAENRLCRGEEQTRQAEDRARQAEEQVRQTEEQARQAEERFREVQAHSAKLEDTVSRLRARTFKGMLRKVLPGRTSSLNKRPQT